MYLLSLHSHENIQCLAVQTTRLGDVQDLHGKLTHDDENICDRLLHQKSISEQIKKKGEEIEIHIYCHTKLISGCLLLPANLEQLSCMVIS